MTGILEVVHTLSILINSINYHGPENHSREILEFLPSLDTLKNREDEILTKEFISQDQCMNRATVSAGNDPGWWFKTSEERQHEISLAASIRGKKIWETRKADPNFEMWQQTEEWIKNRAIANTGKKRTAKQKENLQNGQQKYYSTVDPEILKERGKKTAEKIAKSWTIEAEDGSLQEVKNLKQFSIEHSIKGTHLYKTIGNRKFCNGFRVFIEGQPAKAKVTPKKRTSMPVERREARSNSMKGDSRLSVRACCIHCQKETTAVAIKQFHKKCLK